mmetsp:Transcript_26638/g.29030  ORF Transcript_26638/g.29030 Transcript_26638/m.29030 type:complete len:399 (+) Transcript_26638:203-1399(+)|eukprot:gene9531-10349_t
MDAIDLLLFASSSLPERSSTVSNNDSIEGATDTSTKYTDSDTEAVDAILALKQKFATSVGNRSITPEENVRRPRFNTLDSISENEEFGHPDTGKSSQPEEFFPKSYRRPRAMSEPWSSNNPYHWVNKSTSPATLLSHASHAVDDMHLNPSSLVANFFDKYSSIYNKNGRIGIYTQEERAAIIARYREKKKRRNWKKQIRYYCRKNLADRRVRVRGRFVKLEDLPKEMIESGDINHDGLEEEYDDDDVNAMDVVGKSSHQLSAMTIGGVMRKRSNSLSSPKASRTPKSFLPPPPCLSTAEPLSIHLRSPQASPQTVGGPSNVNIPAPKLTINLSQIRMKRDRYNNLSAGAGAPLVKEELGEVNNRMSFLVDALNGLGDSNINEAEDPPGKRMRRHSIAY